MSNCKIVHLEEPLGSWMKNNSIQIEIALLLQIKEVRMEWCPLKNCGRFDNTL